MDNSRTGRRTALLWFRQDLRLLDNPALIHAVENDYAVLPVFILDDVNAGRWKMGDASRWWLHESLKSLNKTMNERMLFRIGNAAQIIPDMARKTGAEAVFWNRCYEPWRIEHDQRIEKILENEGISVRTFNASLLWEPWTVTKDDGSPYRIFTPYYRKCSLVDVPAPRSSPASIAFADENADRGSLDDLRLLPSIKWYGDMEYLWLPGEAGALARLKTFLENGLKGYKDLRNRPDMENTSRLSPHLHFGEISPRAVWHGARAAGIAQGLESDLDNFCSELGWREFSTYLLYYFPQMEWNNLNPRFDAIPWKKDRESEELRRWQRGLTGIPIADAGMRQLWRTGWMHNRVRMIAASLLVKNMMVHWQRGAEWFWDTLVDADLANNSASWQWVAGSGADAAPYFRIFNPVMQGRKFDPKGDYIRAHVPELADLPDKYVHAPWTAPVPPADYPAPIVDLQKSRLMALEVFGKTKPKV